MEQVTLLRKPDYSVGATDNSPFRFEERANSCDNPVKFDYIVEKNSAKVVVYPSGSPVKFLKLRFNGDFSAVDKVFGDTWERSGQNTYIEWRSRMNCRILPWYLYAKEGETTFCYGVKTGADAFCFWGLDSDGVTLFINLTCGAGGADLKEPIVACEVVEYFGAAGEDSYAVAAKFAKMMCETPVLPKTPVFGVNNWYWAYGKITRETVRTETDYLIEMTSGVKNRPYMIIDDGWQINRTFGDNAYIGGPWVANDGFKNMADTVADIHARGAKAGIWFRPLLDKSNAPEAAKLTTLNGGYILDPTHPYTLEKVFCDAQLIRGYGFDLIKHDFSTMDITGMAPLKSSVDVCLTNDRKFFDRTKPLATVIKNLYKTLQKGVLTDVIGCNTISHLTAGIHSLYRVGDDTSGRSFEWTVRHGVNSMMRLPLNNSFYNVDPDCAAFTENVGASVNLDYLEMCALTGVTTLASVTPHILSGDEMKRINEIFKIADKGTERYTIKNYDKNATPDEFVSADGKTTKKFKWTSEYNGSRYNLRWNE